MLPGCAGRMTGACPRWLPGRPPPPSPPPFTSVCGAASEPLLRPSHSSPYAPRDKMAQARGMIAAALCYLAAAPCSFAAADAAFSLSWRPSTRLQYIKDTPLAVLLHHNHARVCSYGLRGSSEKK